MSEPGHDGEYAPPDSGRGWLAGPRRILILGQATDELARLLDSADTDARSVMSRLASRALHQGVYRFNRGSLFDIVLVLDGLSPTAAESVRLRRSDGHIREAAEFLEDAWATSASVHGPSSFTPGMVVHPNGSPHAFGIVSDVRRTSNGHEVYVDIDGAIRNYMSDDLTRVAGDYRLASDWLARPPADAERIAATLTWLKLANPLSDTLYSYASTRTVFKSFQFIPVLKMLRSPTGRLLVADEVGLGKTIEAGLIWTELEQREPMRRALVVVPSALRFKWQGEMRNRFMRPLRVLGRPDLEEFVAEIERGEDPDLVGIVTLESIRTNTKLLARLGSLRPQFQLVIIDEAHQMRNRRTASYHVGNLLSDLSDNLVFLSATPLNLGEDDLFNLVNVLDPGGFPDSQVFRDQLEPNRVLNEVGRLLADPATRNSLKPRERLKELATLPHGLALTARPDFGRLSALIAQPKKIGATEVAESRRLIAELNTLGQIFTRTRKVDVPVNKAVRQAESIEVEWTSSERRLYDAVFSHHHERARRSGHHAGFLMQMPLRMACSSLAVMQARLAEREGWEISTSFEDEGAAWEIDDEFESEDFETDELSELRTLVLKTRLEVDSKYDALVRTLHDIRAKGMKQALIFSFFRGTVEYLVGRLNHDGILAQPLHGGVPSETRESVIGHFQGGKFDVLVANQVGSEGLDFQFCNVLVNYDLPWNPMQVEQRIGRLDRFGQEAEKIFIFNMHVPGTIESDIVERLYTRIGIFERSIGDLEPILRDRLSELNSLILDPRLSPTQRQREIDRFEIATKRREQELKTLEESSGLLSSLHQLDVEGMTDAGPSDGRYVGHSELRRLIARLARGFDTPLIDDGGVLRLVGSDRLARELSDFAVIDVGTSRRRGVLIQGLRSGAELVITFDPNHPDPAAEFISARHPLIRFEVERMRRTRATLPRFGEARINGIAASYLAQIDIVRTAGVTPTCEMWVTAIDIIAGTRTPDVESRILESLAQGSLGEVAPPAESKADLGDAVSLLDAAVSDRWWRFREDRLVENAALAEARIASRRSALQLKIDNARRTLGIVSDPSLIRMYEGTIRGHQERIAGLENERAMLANLAPNRTPEAYLLVRA